MDFSQEIIEQVRELHDMKIELLIKKIKSVRSDSSQIVESIRAIDKHQSDFKAHYSTISKHLAAAKKAAIDPKEVHSVFDELASWIKVVEEQLEKTKAILIKDFAKELDALLGNETSRLRKWGDGLTAGLFSIETLPDRRKIRLWYGPKQVKLDELDMTAQVVAKCLEKRRSELGSKQPSEKFLSTLERAFYRVTGSSKSTWVPISDILPEVAFLLQPKAYRNMPTRKNYIEYLRQDLSYDLYQLRAKGNPKGLQLRTATLAKTKSERDSLWVPSSDSIDGGEHYSEIRFTEDT